MDKFEREEFLQGLTNSIAERQAAESEAVQRRVDAENGSIQTTEILHQIKAQIDQERTERLEFQHKVNVAAEQQAKTDTRRFIFTALVGILTFLAGFVAAVAAALALIPR